VLLAVALLTLAAGALALAQARIDSDLSRLIRPSDALAWYRHDGAFKAAFPELQQTAVVVASGDDWLSVRATAERLRDALRAHEEFEAVHAPSLAPFLADRRLMFVPLEDLERWTEGVDYAYGPLLRLSEGADLANGAFTLADQLAANPRQTLPHPLASLAEAFLDGPPERIALEGWPHLVPEIEGIHHELIVAKGRQRHEESLPNARQVALLREVVATTPADPGVTVRLTGEVKLADEEIGAALSGIELAGTLSLVLLAIVLGVGVRSWRVIVAIFTVLATGIVLTLGWATLAVGSFNTLALIFVVMFFGLGVDFAVHFALRAGEPDADGAPAGAAAAARDVGGALLLCGLTSAIAFLSFAPTAYRGLGELGVISAGGMAIAVALSLTVIPAVLALLGTPRTPASTTLTARRELPAGVVLTGALIVALLALWGARDLRFDYSVLAMRDASTEGMATLLELQDADIATDYSIAVLADDEAHARALRETLEALPEVGAVSDPTDLVPGRQAEKRAALVATQALVDTLEAVQSGSTSEFLPEAVELLEEYRDAVPDDAEVAFEAFLAALRVLPDGERLRLDAELARALAEEIEGLRTLLAVEAFALDDLPRELTALMIAGDGRPLLRVQPADALTSRAATERFVRAVAEVAPNYAGRTVVEWGVGAVVVESFLQAATLALAGIALVLVLHFRGIVLPLLVLVPITLAVLVTGAVMQQTGLTLNMANILVVPLVFGLGVDTGIHVVDRFRHAGDLTRLRASSTPRAVLISGLTTVGTFASLSFSPHGGAASIGLLLGIAISVMLLATFLVLPALLRVTQRGA
jgi:hopanoid biosynthesis associated RND transporter like protein HpnN